MNPTQYVIVHRKKDGQVDFLQLVIGLDVIDQVKALNEKGSKFTVYQLGDCIVYES